MMAHQNKLFRVCIAVCTYRRGAQLLELLRSLQKAELRCAGVGGVELLIVDNDPDQSAKDLVTRMQPMMGLPVRYVSETTRGLVAARNRALAATAESDLLVFLDDDEWVVPGWFPALVGTMIATEAQFVIGPVRPIFPAGASDIYSKSGLFHREEFIDQHAVSSGNTGNCCIDLRWLRSCKITFRDEFNRSGGEDVTFFTEMTQAGAQGRYAANAIVYEPVPQERLSVPWLLRRRMRFGAITVIQRLTLNGMGFLGRLTCALEGVARFLMGCLLSGLLYFVLPHLSLKYAAAAALGIGYFLGAFRVNVREY